MTLRRKISLTQIAVAVVAITAAAILCCAIAGWKQAITLYDGLEHGFELTGTYDREGSAGPYRVSFVVKQYDDYDGLWQASNAESGLAFKHEEGWLRQTKAPNLYELIGRDGSQKGWVAASGLESHIIGKGQRIIVEYDSVQSWFSCSGLEPSREGPELSFGYAGSSLSNLSPAEWFDGPEAA